MPSQDVGVSRRFPTHPDWNPYPGAAVQIYRFAGRGSGDGRAAASVTWPAVFSTNWSELSSDWSTAPNRSAKSDS